MLKTQDKNIQNKIKPVLENNDLKQMSTHFNNLDNGVNFGNSNIERKIGLIVEDNLDTLQQLQILIHILKTESDFVDDSGLDKFKFKSLPKEQPKKDVIKSNTSNKA